MAMNFIYKKKKKDVSLKLEPVINHFFFKFDLTLNYLIKSKINWILFKLKRE